MPDGVAQLPAADGRVVGEQEFERVVDGDRAIEFGIGPEVFPDPGLAVEPPREGKSGGREKATTKRCVRERGRSAGESRARRGVGAGAASTVAWVRDWLGALFWGERVARGSAQTNKGGSEIRADRGTGRRLAGIFHTQLDQTDFTEDTEARPQSSQSGQGVWLRDLGSKLGALGEKEFLQESVIDAG